MATSVWIAFMVAIPVPMDLPAPNALRSSTWMAPSNVFSVLSQWSVVPVAHHLLFASPALLPSFSKVILAHLACPQSMDAWSVLTLLNVWCAKMAIIFPFKNFFTRGTYLFIQVLTSDIRTIK